MRGSDADGSPVKRLSRKNTCVVYSFTHFLQTSQLNAGPTVETLACLRECAHRTCVEKPPYELLRSQQLISWQVILEMKVSEGTRADMSAPVAGKGKQHADAALSSFSNS